MGGSKEPARIVYALECARYKNMHLYFPLKFDTVGSVFAKLSKDVVKRTAEINEVDTLFIQEVWITQYHAAQNTNK